MTDKLAENFTDGERAVFYRVVYARRDMRHFLPETQVPEDTLKRILAAAHAAPSVGLMRPWRFIRIRDPELREDIAQLVEAERQRTAEALGSRGEEFLRLKVEGVRECAELIAVIQAPEDGTVFGRRTLPAEMALCSTACAIENLWLASRAENLGMGWVSMFDPAALASLLKCPTGAKPIALLCLGPVAKFYPEPMLEQVGWRRGLPLEDVVFEDGWQNTMTHPTETK